MQMEVSTTAAGLGVVGAALAAVVYILWGPEYLFKQKGRCVGLENLGNTCFINAVLQALASVGCVLQWLQSVHAGKLNGALQHILQSLRKDGNGVVSPAPVLQALVWHGWVLDQQQQDAHELYHVFLTTLAEEREECPSLLAVPQALLLAMPEDSPSDCVAYTRAGPISIIPRSNPCPLQGLLASELACVTCQHTSPIKYEMFDSLSLNLPLHQPQCSLHSCLMDFIKSEVVADVVCTKCSQLSGSTVKRKFMKRLQLARAPPILCLHLKRTVWLPSGSLHKSAVSVAFPVHLDLSAIMKTEDHSYDLVAMIEHLGGPLSGHYITYRRVQGSHWVQTSDTSVYRCNLSDVMNASAYMLFYSKV